MKNFRIEYKYYVPLEIRSFLLKDLQSFTYQDENSCKNKDGAYEVSSIYMDNYNLSSYRDKITGKNIRQKVRFRFYPPLKEDSYFFIELKNRGANKINKVKSKISFSLFMEVVKRNSNALKIKDPDPILSHVARLAKVGCFHLFILINYKRIARFAKLDPAVRITIDSNVYCNRFQENIGLKPHIPVVPQRWSILEIKTPGYFPDWMRYIIKKYGLKREAISKYALSVQSLAVNSSMVLK